MILLSKWHTKNKLTIKITITNGTKHKESKLINYPLWGTVRLRKYILLKCQ